MSVANSEGQPGQEKQEEEEAEASDKEETKEIDNKEAAKPKWDEMFELLAQFRQTNGHVNVPKRFKELGLGEWVSLQQKKGRKGQLDPRRSQRLLEIGLEWGAGIGMTSLRN
jgi:hypothetical protein